MTIFQQPQLSFGDVCINLVKEPGEFSIGKIAFHLLIPCVVLSIMETGCRFRSLFKGELSNGLFDLLHTHGGSLPLKRKEATALQATFEKTD
jgi:hypothetical protein